MVILLSVNIPRQSRGLYGVSRSKRLERVANAAPTLLGPPFGGYFHILSWSSRLSSTSWLRMYSRIAVSSRPTVDTK